MLPQGWPTEGPFQSVLQLCGEFPSEPDSCVQHASDTPADSRAHAPSTSPQPAGQSRDSTARTLGLASRDCYLRPSGWTQSLGRPMALDYTSDLETRCG